MLDELHHTSALCNNAKFDVLSIDRPVMDRDVQDNASNGALLKFAEAAQDQLS